VSASTVPKASASFTRMLRPRRPSAAVALARTADGAGIGRDRLGIMVDTLRRGSLQAGDRLVLAVGLQHGEVDIVETEVALRTVLQGYAAQVERPGLDHGVDEVLAGRLAVDLAQHRDRQAPGEIAFERAEGRLVVAAQRLERGLVALDRRDRLVG